MRPNVETAVNILTVIDHRTASESNDTKILIDSYALIKNLVIWQRELNLLSSVD